MYAATDIGRLRKKNEDCVKAVSELGFAVLADGMGGYNAGDVASQMAVSIISNELSRQLPGISHHQQDSLSALNSVARLSRDAVMHANDAVYHASMSKQAYAGMGTTILTALFFEDQLCTAHAGDSRMYRLRSHSLTTLTHDHSLVHEQIRRGLISPDEARKARRRNLVTRALGVKSGMQPELVEDTVEIGDLYLLCSDGLTDIVTDDMIEQILNQHKELKETADALIELANVGGGPDNISVIIIEAKAVKKRSLLSRILRK